MTKFEISSEIIRIIQFPKTLAIKYIRTNISRYSKLLNSQTLMNFIGSFNQNARNLFTWTDKWRLISEKFCTAMNPHEIRRTLRRILLLTTKNYCKQKKLD